MQRVVLGRVDNEQTVVWLHTTDCTCFTISLQMNCVLGQHDLFKFHGRPINNPCVSFRPPVLNLLAKKTEHMLQGWFVGAKGWGIAQSDWQYGQMGLVVRH